MCYCPANVEAPATLARAKTTVQSTKRGRHTKSDDYADEKSLHKAKRSRPDVDTAKDLAEAARTGDVTSMKSILDEGCDIDQKVLGCSALHYACFYNKVEAVEILLEAGADFDICDLSGKPPLHWAVEQRHEDIVAILIDVGADIAIADMSGMDALQKASKLGSIKMCKQLHAAGADINRKSEADGQTPLHFAASNGSVDVLFYLLNNGADPNATTDNGATSLYKAICQNHKACVKALLEARAAIDTTDKMGRTVLHWCCFFSNADLAALLLKENAPLDVTDIMGLTPRDIARNKKNEKLRQLIHSATDGA